ncbi:MAG: type I methionyl aminopeptidase [Planctomycetes bacterium]|nr:type I methionyl aminopeptidase [Planctomycetota bacterium]
MIYYKSRREIDLMQYAGQVLASLFEKVGPLIKPGVTTEELDRSIHEWMLQEDCIPSFLGYRGFPAVSCISVNEEVVHGIPGPRRLAEGDLVTIDLGVIWKGYHADAARTFGVGAISEEATRLRDATERALDLGIEAIRVGGRVSEVGAAIQSYAEGLGFSVVKDYVGHGIGRDLHEEPQVPNFVDEGRRRRDHLLKRGLVIAVEPMLNVGGEGVETLEDDWTVVTRDRKLSAHFEDTIAITENGPLVLTRHR